MADNSSNKAAVSEVVINELSRYVLGAIPVMAKVDMASEEMKFYDEIGKYVLGGVPLMVNPDDITDKNK